MYETVADEALAASADLFALMKCIFAMTDDPLAKLPLAQFRVCDLLYERPRSLSELGRELKVTLSAITQIADRLERNGLVKRITEGSDRRKRLLRLTARGEKLLRHREEARHEKMTSLLSRLPPPRRAEVITSLKTLADTAAAVLPAYPDGVSFPYEPQTTSCLTS